MMYKSFFILTNLFDLLLRKGKVGLEPVHLVCSSQVGLRKEQILHTGHIKPWGIGSGEMTQCIAENEISLKGAFEKVVSNMS